MRELEVGRLFVCAHCRVQVVLCRRCDRGNVYCGQTCARIQRQLSLRAAGARYQRSPAGRFAHALRARRYRDRRNKVTHQGFAGPALPDQIGPPATASPSPLPPASPAESTPAASAEPVHEPSAGRNAPRCSRCEAPRSEAVRQGWVRRWSGPPIGGRHAGSPWSGLLNDSP